MSFRDNLQHLRATRNMTQEQLAMLVGVSRQSVTKWEAERAYPEMDKLLKLCQIFDCTLDELVQGDLTARAPEPELAVPATALAEDVIGYDEQHCAYARRMALGCACVICGAAAAAALDGLAGDGLSGIGFFVFVALGLYLIIPAAMGESAFKKAHPYVANFYTSEQVMEERKVFAKRLALGIAIILFSLAAETFVSQYGDFAVTNGLFLAGVALGVGLIVYGSLMDDRVDIEDYNISALEELSEEEIASIVGEERAPKVLEKVRRSKRKGAACGVIMLVATAIAIPLLFWATSYGDPFWIRFFWLPWMVGGLFCGAVCIIIDQRS